LNPLPETITSAWLTALLEIVGACKIGGLGTDVGDICSRRKGADFHLFYNLAIHNPDFLAALAYPPLS
jgi:hypothetical protein